MKKTSPFLLLTLPFYRSNNKNLAWNTVSLNKMKVHEPMLIQCFNFVTIKNLRKQYIWFFQVFRIRKLEYRWIDLSIRRLSRNFSSNASKQLLDVTYFLCLLPPPQLSPPTHHLCLFLRKSPISIYYDFPSNFQFQFKMPIPLLDRPLFY